MNHAMIVCDDGPAMDEKMYRWNVNVESVELNGEWVIMQTHHFTVTKLNESGGEIWSMLREPISVSALVNRLCEEYQVSFETAETDVCAFIKDLDAAGLLENVR